MAGYKEIDTILKNDGDITDLNFSKGRMRNLLLDLIEYKVDHFKYNDTYDYNYLLKIFDYFPYYFQVNFKNKKEFYLRVKTIRNKVKNLLIQKPGNISKSSKNFQFLKNLIDHLETVSLSFLYDYIDRYDGSKYDFINFLVFDVKRISLFYDAINRFPYIVNFETKNGDSLINNVIKKYILEIEKYTSGKELNGLDDVIYYDEVLKLLLNSSKLIFNVADRQKWLSYINNLINNIDSFNHNSLTKQKYVFFLNDLSYKLRKINNNNLEYLKYKYDIKENFNQSINMECLRILENVYHNDKRKLIDDMVITIDCHDSHEIDDALSVKILENGNFLLGVHIADPLFYINNNSIIYDEAKRRTTSIYLSDLTVSMFPPEISSDVANLLEGKIRPATSYYYEIASDGEVINYKFYKSYINVYKNMTYDDFNSILVNGCDNEQIYQMIQNFTKIQPILATKYNIDPYYEKINRSDNNITDTNIIGHSLAEKIVESAMIFNNYMVANYFDQHKLPFIYRIHAIDNDTINRISKFSESIKLDGLELEYLKYIEFIKNLYPKATYSTTNQGHYGLGISAYTHITSPLRRFADIIANDCLNRMYFNSFDDKDIYEIEEDLKKSVNSINQKRLSIELFSEKYEKSRH